MIDPSFKLPIIAHDDGLYFGLPFDDYLAEQRFSFHAGKDMLISPLTCWTNYFDPEREDNDSKAKLIGRAFHTRILEGASVFMDRFAVKPVCNDTFIDGGDALRKRCEELELKKGGSIAELCERILAADPTAQLWPVFMREWAELNQGKDLLTDDEWRNIERPARMIGLNPYSAAAFAGGYPEVSIFWTDEETGVRCKTRADYLKVKDIIEVKTFSNPLGKKIDEAVAHTLANQKYHMQGRILLEGVRHAKDFVRNGDFHGEPEPAWLKAFAETENHTLSWVFVQQGAVSEIRVREFQQHLHAGASDNVHWTHGGVLFRLAIRDYAACLEHYGTELPWLNPEPRRGFDDSEFAMYHFN